MKKTLFLLAVSSPLLLTSCSFFYVIKQGVYQIKLITDAEPIETVLRVKDLDPSVRKKLELILDVRQFATTKLKLVAHKNYKDVNLSWTHAIHTVSASEPLQFKPYLWWFPIIGSVPYKGFFEEQDARLLEAQLKKQGFETLLGKIHGYSTLGYFSDPVWPSMLALKNEELIELIIHELTHATVYIPNQTTFNETLANFVGKKGARAYISQRFGNKSKELKDIEHHQKEHSLYREFFYDLFKQLDQLYKSSLVDEEKKIAKKKIFNDAYKKYLLLPIEDAFKNADWSKVNNAYLMSFKRYNYDEKIFEDLLAAVNGNFAKFFEETQFYGRSEDPFSALKSRLKAHRLP